MGELGEVFERILGRAGARAFSEYGVMGIASVFVACFVLLYVTKFLRYAFKRRAELGVWFQTHGQVKTETIYSGVCAAVLLIAAFTEWPYFMYVLIRVFICGSSAYIASSLYSRNRVPLTWLFGTIAVLFNPILPVRTARSDWQATNVIAAVIFIGFSVYLNWDSLSQRQSRKIQQTRLLVRTVAKICGRMHGQEIRILELDPADSALSDFFVITTAADHQHAITIANEIELRLKNDWGLSQLLDGRTCGWILLDYVDFEVHIFPKDQRAFYDIERARKSAKSFTPTEFDKTIKHCRCG